MQTLLVSPLRENEGHSDQFLQDVLRLLSVHAAKSALKLQFRAASGPNLMADLPSSGLPLVTRFRGAHRAQLVPDGSPAGRVITVRIMIECIEQGGSSSLHEAAVAAFTYSYPLGVVTEHRTGQQYALREFLEGCAG